MIPLEDNFDDILGKAQRGLKLSDMQLAQKAGVTTDELRQVKAGQFEETTVRKLAPILGLGADALVAIGKKAWRPVERQLAGLATFTTPFETMMVNAYLVWEQKTNQAAIFDTGSDCGDIVQFVKTRNLTVAAILLTHSHFDHVSDLRRLKPETRAQAFIGEHERFDEAEPFQEGKIFAVGGLRIETRQTSGHSSGGMTYVVTGLAKPVAVVGDALFAGSIGGGTVSYADAVQNNRKKILSLPDDTILCPGHGPLTTVGEEKLHNPFFPEFAAPTA